MNQLVQSVTGLVFYSPDVERLAGFYSGLLGAPLEPVSHGTQGQHREGLFAGVHFAFWDSHAGHAPGTAPALVPTFRTADLDAAERSLLERGAHRLHKPIALGEGKRVVGFTDPDGRAFRLIEIGSR